VETSRGDAAAAAWIFRRGSRGDAAARATELGETKTVFAASGLPASSLLDGPRPRGDAAARATDGERFR